MRILSDGLIYNFTVSQLNNDDDVSHVTTNQPFDEFIINFRFRKSIEIDIQRTLQIPRVSLQFAAIMSDLLGEFEVPTRPKSDMAANFKFHLDRLIRIGYRGDTVEVKLEAEAVTSERAALMQNRMDNNNIINNNIRNRFVRRAREAAATEEAMTMMMMPADKKAVAALERVRVFNEEEECAICLERLENDVEVIKMPCSHVYHTGCIIRWLDKNHFCPFCRFKLPC